MENWSQSIQQTIDIIDRFVLLLADAAVNDVNRLLNAL